MIFKGVMRVMLAGVIKLGKLDLESRAGRLTKICSLLLGFSFKWFQKKHLIRRERQSDIVSKLGLGSS